MGERRKRIFLCNGKARGCKKNSCYMRGGECRHTSNVAYVKFSDTQKGRNKSIEKIATKDATVGKTARRHGL